MRERLKPESLRESLMKVSILNVLSLGVSGQGLYFGNPFL
jgi:hypothetical protein